MVLCDQVMTVMAPQDGRSSAGLISPHSEKEGTCIVNKLSRNYLCSGTCIICPTLIYLSDCLISFIKPLNFYFPTVTKNDFFIILSYYKSNCHSIFGS